MKGIAIPELKPGEEVPLDVVATSVRERRTQQGELFYLANARNSSGSVGIKVPARAAPEGKPFIPGLWRIAGRLESFQNQPQFVVSECRPITVADYRELQGDEPILPRAYTLDIETIPLADFRERAGLKLKRALRASRMSAEQEERYSIDSAAEEEHSYRLGSLAATSGRILSIAVHVAPLPEIKVPEIEAPTVVQEYVFGIDSEGREQPERQALIGFLELMSRFDPEADEIVGHNILAFDLPFIFQRCLVNNIPGAPFVNLSEYNARSVYDTMVRWWLGSRNRVSLDDLAWALGLPSSKTEEVEGSRVFDLYHAGELARIREYNLNDVRLTRRVYERMIAGWGR